MLKHFRSFVWKYCQVFMLSSLLSTFLWRFQQQEQQKQKEKFCNFDKQLNTFVCCLFSNFSSSLRANGAMKLVGFP